MAQGGLAAGAALALVLGYLALGALHGDPDRPPVGHAAGPGAVTSTSSPGSTAADPALPPHTPVPVISRVVTQEPVIFLGIDDGLTRDPAVLDYLAAHDIPFVNFVVAGPLQADPAFWVRAHTSGGTIQAHTLTHPNLARSSAEKIRAEICGSADLIQTQTGVRPTLFRPPYGVYNDTVRLIAAECGFRALVMWTGATNDGRVDFQQGRITPGDILLLHWRADLLQNLRNLVALVRAQGFRIGRLEDCLAPPP